MSLKQFFSWKQSSLSYFLGLGFEKSNLRLGKCLLFKLVFKELIIFVSIMIISCLGLFGPKEDPKVCSVGIIRIISNLLIQKFMGWIENCNKLAVKYWNLGWNFTFKYWNFDQCFIKLQIINWAKQLFTIHFNFELNFKG